VELSPVVGASFITLGLEGVAGDLMIPKGVSVVSFYVVWIISFESKQRGI